MRAARQLSSGEPLPDQFRPATSRPSTALHSGPPLSASTLLPSLRLASAVLMPPPPLGGSGDPASRGAVNDAAAGSNAQQKNTSLDLPPHESVGKSGTDQKLGAGSALAKASAEHAAHLSELFAAMGASVDEAPSPTADDAPDARLDGVLASLQKCKSSIQEQMESSVPDSSESDAAVLAASSAGASSMALLDDDEDEGEDEGIYEEEEEVAERLRVAFPSCAASSLFASGSPELKEMALDRLMSHLRGRAGAPQADTPSSPGAPSSLHAAAAEAEEQAAYAEASAAAHGVASGATADEPPRFWARSASLDPSDGILGGGAADGGDTADDDASSSAPDAEPSEQVEACTSVLREALLDSEVRVTLSALTMLDPDGPLLASLLEAAGRAHAKAALARLLAPLVQCLGAKSHRASHGAMLALHAIVTHPLAEPRRMLPQLLRPLRVATAANSPPWVATGGAPAPAPAAAGPGSRQATASPILDPPRLCTMRLTLAHKLLLHGGPLTRGRGVISPSHALPLLVDSLRATDVETRQAATDLLVRAHAIAPSTAETWLSAQPAISPLLSEQLGACLSTARQRLLRPSSGSSGTGMRSSLAMGGLQDGLQDGGSRPGTSSRGGSGGLGGTNRPATAVTLANLLQRPATAMNGGAGLGGAALGLPPACGGVRAALEREGMRSSAGGATAPGGSCGEEPQILRLE